MIAGYILFWIAIALGSPTTDVAQCHYHLDGATITKIYKDGEYEYTKVNLPHRCE